MSKYDMDKLEDQEMKKIRPIKRNWFDRLIKPNVIGKKPKRIRNKLKDEIIIDIWTLLKPKKKKNIEKTEAKWKNNLGSKN